MQDCYSWFMSSPCSPAALCSDLSLEDWGGKTRQRDQQASLFPGGKLPSERAVLQNADISRGFAYGNTPTHGKMGVIILDKASLCY